MEEGKLGAHRSGQPLHPGVREDDGRRRATRRASSRAGEAADHDPRSADAHRRHLLRHRSRTSPRCTQAKGLGPAAGYGWYTADKDEPICDTMERLASLPFVAQPGEAWVYGYNTDILGCVVERAAGMPLDEFIRTRITGPLGMKDTQFFLPAGAARRGWRRCTRADADGKIVRAPDGAQGQGALRRRSAQELRRRRRPAVHGARLRALPRDDPQRRRARRRPHPVAAHGRADDDQPGRHAALADRPRASASASRRPIATAPTAWTRSASFGWGGAYGTIYRVDPEERLVLVLMIQLHAERDRHRPEVSDAGLSGARPTLNAMNDPRLPRAPRPPLTL